jgi:hypothetical protein
LGFTLLLGGAACGDGVQTQTQPNETAPVPASSAKSPVGTITSNPDGNIKEFTPTSLQPTTPEQAATSTDTLVVPTKTSEGVDYSAAFNVDPQSEADFGQVIEAPPRFDDPTDFAKWEDGYLAAVDAKLVDYQGPFIDSDLSFGYTNKTFEFDPVLVKPIACYKWLWKAPDGTEKTVITKSFPIRDKATGKKSSISVTYSVDSAFGGGIYANGYGVVGEYGTATVKAPIRLWYSSSGWQNMKTVLPFNVQFLPINSSQAFRMLGDFVQGKGIDSDLDKQLFIWGGYQ